MEDEFEKRVYDLAHFSPVKRYEYLSEENKKTWSMLLGSSLAKRYETLKEKRLKQNPLRENSFEILAVKDITKEERQKHNLFDNDLEFVVKEKVARSSPKVQYHKLGKGGIVQLMRDIEGDKK